MKLNKQITRTSNGLICKYYNTEKAKELYNSKKYTVRKLSMMKQENIRVAIKRKYDLEMLKRIFPAKCGYCFKYQDGKCTNCPAKKLDKSCFDFKEYDQIKNATTLKAFANYHKRWCKRIGLWNDKWE